MRITFQNTLKGERFAANEQIRQNNVNFENVPPTAHCTDTPLVNIVFMKKNIFLKTFFENNFLNLVILFQETKSQNFRIKID